MNFNAGSCNISRFQEEKFIGKFRSQGFRQSLAYLVDTFQALNALNLQF